MKPAGSVRIGLGLSLLVALVIANGVVSHLNTRQLNDDAAWVAHTHRVLTALDILAATAREAENGQRGYLLTGDESYLTIYMKGIDDLPAAVAEVANLTDDNAEQQARVPMLQSLVQSRIDFLRQTLAIYRNEGPAAATAFVQTGQGKTVMDELLVTIAAARNTEQDLLTRRSATNAQTYRTAIQAGGLSVLLGLLAIGLFVWQLQRYVYDQATAAASIYEQRELLQATLLSIGDAAIATDAAGRVTFMNPIAETLTGWTKSEAAGVDLTRVFNIINEATRQPAQNPALRALHEGKIVGLANHTVLISRGGIERPIDDSAAPIRNEAGAIVGCVLIFRDVSEAKAAERAQRESSERRETVLTSALDCIISMDEQGRIVEFNPAAERTLGYSAQQALGAPLAELIIPERFRNDHHRGLAHYLITGEGPVMNRHIELVALKSDGSEIQVELLIAPIPNHVPRLFTAFLRDISARKHSEATLKFLSDASSQLASLTDRASTLQKVARMTVPFLADWCVVYIRKDGQQIERTAAAHINVEQQQLLDQLQAVHPIDLESDSPPARTMRTGQADLQAEVTDEFLTTLATSPAHLDLLRRLHPKSHIMVPLRIRNKTVGAIGLILSESNRHYDAADLHVAEELARRAAVAVENAHLYQELREADRRKDEFMATLAHELRNPLAPIRNALELLTPDADRETARWARELMQRQVEHIVRLVDELLDVSRVMQGKVRLRKESVDLSKVIQHAVEEARPMMLAQEQKFSIALPADPIWVLADPVRLAQIVSNLLTNAAKYTNKQGAIELLVERVGGDAMIRVRDTGIGIAPDMLHRIFEPFTQVVDSLDRSRGGLGIGLALVHTLVELHDGSVSARSDGPGRGAEFTVRLPASAAQPVVKDVTWQPVHVAARRVLVVDDNVGAAQTLAKLLKKFWQHEVEIAHDGPAAFEMVARFDPDVVLLDIGLPGLSGYEVAERLRLQPRTKPLLLVALTGYGQDEDRRRSREAGFDQHLIKPVSVQVLQQLFATPTAEDSTAEGTRG